MRTHIAATAFAVLLGLASLAQAAQLLSPPLPINSRTNVGITGACRGPQTPGPPRSPCRYSLFSNNELSWLRRRHLSTRRHCLEGKPVDVIVYAMPADSYAACKATASNVSKLRGTLEVWEDEWPITVRVAEELN